MLPWDEERSREEGSKRQLKGGRRQTATQKPDQTEVGDHLNERHGLLLVLGLKQTDDATVGLNGDKYILPAGKP